MGIEATTFAVFYLVLSMCLFSLNFLLNRARNVEIGFVIGSKFRYAELPMLFSKFYKYKRFFKHLFRLLGVLISVLMYDEIFDRFGTQIEGETITKRSSLL